MSARDLLVVEDEAVVRAAARRILEAEGLVVDLAEDARMAATALRRHRYRVLLCDLMLPGSSGFDLIRLARELDPVVQTVVVTGYATLRNAIGSFRLGAFDFIPKPFDPAEIRGVVVRALAFHGLMVSGGATASRAGAPGHGDDAAATHWLGGHAWARIQRESSVTLGAAETFFEVLRRPGSIALPRIGDRVTQGRKLARILSDGDLVHRVWAPLSGLIVAVNDRLSSEPDLLIREPLTGGWLVKIVPDNLEEELSELHGGRAQRNPAKEGRPG